MVLDWERYDYVLLAAFYISPQVSSVRMSKNSKVRDKDSLTSFPNWKSGLERENEATHKNTL